MSGMDIVPSFFPEKDDDGLVPAEFNDTPEAKIRRMVGVPEPAPERLITPMNPQGRAPRDGMGFQENVSGQFRSGTFSGAMAEAAQTEAVTSGGEQFRRGGFSEQQFRNLPSSVRNRIIDEASKPGVQEQKLQDAEDAFYAQIAYDNSKSNLSPASVAGAIVGSIATPENLGGLSGFLVRQFPKLAARPVVTSGVDAAMTNLLVDPVVQGSRMFSGAQAEYDPTQTVLAPIIGFTIGAGGRAIPELPSMVRERQAAELGVDPEVLKPQEVAPVSAPAKATDAASAPEATAAPAKAVDAAPAPIEPGVDPVIAKAVDEALPETVAEVAPSESAVAARSANDAVVVDVAPSARVDSGQAAAAATPTERATLKVTRGEDGRISGIDLEGSGLELTRADDGGVLFRKRGMQPVQQLPPNQIQLGRPVADQGTSAVATPEIVTRIQRLEDVSRNLVQSFEGLGRQGRVTPGAMGQFSTTTGVTRVKSIADLDTVAHEVGHDFHLTKARQDVDAIVAKHGLELQALGAGDKKGNQEAFAELFRLYAVNRNYAAQAYPQATAALDTLLRSKFPKQAEAIDNLRAQLDAIYRAPSGELVTADTIQSAPPKFGDRFKELAKPDRDPSGRSVYSAFDALYTATVDRTHPVWKAVQNLADIAKRNGKPVDIKPVDDTYILARMLPGSHSGAAVMLEHGVIPAGAVDPQGPSLKSAIERALGQKWDEKGFSDFGGYLVARRMVAEYTRFFNGEIPNPPGKFSLADYQRAVAEIEAANPQFRDAAQDVYGFLTNHLKRAYDKGLFSKEYYDAALKRVDYVPFVRDMADFADDSAQGVGATGKPAGLRYSLMKAFKGSQRSVQNPLESIFKRVHDLEYAIALNDTIASLARLADTAGPGSGAIAEAIPSNQLKGQKVDVIEALKSAGRTAGIDSADLQALIIQAEDALGDSTWTTLFRQAEISPGKEPIVFYWANGERRALRLADGRFGRELFHALNAMPDIEKNWFVSTLQVAQQILRTGVTKAPDFLAVNFIRDQLTASSTAGRKYIPFVSAAKGVVDAIRKTDEAVQYAARGGMAAGAISDAIDSSMFGRNVKALENAGVIKSVAAGDVLGAGKALANYTVKALELSEAGTRMGLYKSYYKQAKELGFDDLNASTYAAFKATDYVDFRKAGASMGLLRRWVPFLNAAIQGTDREFRAVLDLPVLELKRGRGETLTATELDRLKDARVAMLRVMGMGAVLGSGLALMNADQEEYQTAPKFTKDTNFLIKVGDTWLAIPKPFGITSAVVNAFEYGADYSVRNDPALAGQWLEAAGRAFMPPTTNPLVSLGYDLPANYNRFQDRPIVPYYLQGVKPSEQYTAGTSEIPKFIGSVTGWSPMKVEYAINNLGGSSALNLLKASDMLMGKDAPEKQVYDWPIARRFVKNLVRGNQATTEFYNLVGDKSGSYEQAENAYKIKIRNGERTAADAYLRALPEDERAWAVLQSQGFEAVEKRLHPMQNAKDRASVISGMLSQLNFNNLIHESDVDRQNTTLSRRAAQPIALDQSTRAKLIENFQELQMIAARNAMVTIGAKGTKGLDVKSDKPIIDRLKAISPDAFKEYQDRLASKKVYDFDVTAKAWPEVKARLLRDGENADLSDLVPAGSRTRRKRSRTQ